jgi:hypothetical protein
MALEGQAQGNGGVSHAALSMGDHAGQPAPAPQQGQPTGKALIIPANQVPRKGVDKEVVYDIRQSSEVASLLADLCEENGLHRQALAIRGQPFDDSISAKFNRTWNKKLTVGNAVTIVVVAGVLFIVYEFVAMKFDWPRAGMFSGPQDLETLKVTKTSTSR